MQQGGVGPPTQMGQLPMQSMSQQAGASGPLPGQLPMPSGAPALPPTHLVPWLLHPHLHHPSVGSTVTI